MKYIFHKSLFVFLLLCFLGSGCISKKKHQEALQALRVTNENVVTDWQNRYNERRAEVSRADQKIRELELNLAERKGENNILVKLRDELQTQIISMESQMNNLGSSSKSVEQNLRSDIKKRDSEILALKQQLASVNVVLDKNKELFNRVSGDISFEMQTSGSDIEVTTRYDQVTLSIPESRLFKKGSSSRITDSGFYLLEKISKVLGRYPQMLFQVTGHTDNTPANEKRYKDNWNFSALQAATVVRALVEDYDMNSSQLTASGKGEYEPRTSNATSEGKAMNRRIEIIVYKPVEDMMKEVKGVTGGF